MNELCSEGGVLNLTVELCPKRGDGSGVVPSSGWMRFLAGLCGMPIRSFLFAMAYCIE
jgi:hypothetical protein